MPLRRTSSFRRIPSESFPLSLSAQLLSRLVRFFSLNESLNENDSEIFVGAAALKLSNTNEATPFLKQNYSKEKTHWYIVQMGRMIIDD